MNDFNLQKIRSDLAERGIATFRIDAFEERCRAGRFAAARRIIAKPCCGARRHKGGQCLIQTLGAGGRCKYHGGKSTGPKTDAGKARIAEAQRKRWAKWRANRH